VRAEKTSENCFYQAMCSAVQKSGIQMVDYCCTESVMVDKVMPGRRYFFMTSFSYCSKSGNKYVEKEEDFKALWCCMAFEHDKQSTNMYRYLYLIVNR